MPQRMLQVNPWISAVDLTIANDPTPLNNPMPPHESLHSLTDVGGRQIEALSDVVTDLDGVQLDT